MKLFVWFAGFFEDDKGSASSKRAALYVCLFYLYLIIRGNLQGQTVDQQVLFCVTGLILFCVGAVTSEFFSKIKSPETTTEHIKKEEITKEKTS